MSDRPNADRRGGHSTRAMLRRAAVAGVAGGLVGVAVGSAAGYYGLLGDTAVFGGVAGAMFGAGLVTLLFGLRQGAEVVRLSSRVRSLEEEDPVTGLANASVLRRDLARILEEAREEHTRTALLAIRIGELAQINNSHGRETGDEVVRALVARIQVAMRDGDELYRADGAHFVVVARDIGPVVTADRLAEQLLEPLGAAYEIDNEMLAASVVIGVAVSDTQGTVLDELLDDAAAAVHKAAGLGPGSIIRFEQSMIERTLTPATAHHRLERALERGEFHLAYMPIRDTTSARIVAVEALLRWTDEQRGVVPAGDFLEAMEQTGLIVPVGEFVLQEACRQATYWARTFPACGPIPVTVNISTRQTAQRDFIDVVAEALGEVDTSPSLLVLEVRENTFLSDQDGPWTALRATKDLGVGLSLDHFGRGASSIATLRALRLDQLKIHRSFVEALEVSAEDRAVVRNLVALAHDLGLVTVGEGVSRREQVAALAELGCDRVQGFFVGEPTSAGAIDELLYRDLDRSAPAVADPTPAAVEPPSVPVADPTPALAGLPQREPGASGAGPQAPPPVREDTPDVIPASAGRRRVSPRRADLFGR